MTKQVLDRSNSSCFPNSRQILLLKAALLSGEAALSAGQEWFRLIDINNLDWGEVRLLPLLYHNLKQQGISESKLPSILKEQYHRTWSENQILFHHASKLIRQFELAKIPTMILKGAALSTQAYPNCGLRPMSDFDFLVPTDRAEESIKILYQNDWQPKVGAEYYYPKKFTKDYTCFRHSWDFVNSSQKNIDLHWHVFHNSLALDADLDFWASARSIEIAGSQTLMLDPADQLLHVCTHGANWNSAIPIRWVADAIIIIYKYPDLDWQRLIKQTIKRRLMLPMQATLQFLVTYLAAPIPQEVLQELSSTKPTHQEEYYYQLITTIPSKQNFFKKIGFVMDTGRIYYCYRKGLAANTSISLLTQIYNLPNFLQLYFGADGVWQIAIVGISKILRHI